MHTTAKPRLHASLGVSLEKMLNPGVCARLAMTGKRVVGAGCIAEGIGVQAKVRISAVACGRNLEIEQGTLRQVVGAADRVDGRVPTTVVRVDVIHRAYKRGRLRSLPCHAAPFLASGCDAARQSAGS